MKRSREMRLADLEAARARIVARVGTGRHDPRCTPDHLAQMSWEELRALALELGVMAPHGAEPQPGQLPHDLDALTSPELVSLYFKRKP